MRKHLITLALALGTLVGASAISAFAAGTWTAPSCNPPACNTDAPINVGSIIQEKAGGLWIHGGVAVDGNLVVATSSPTWGKVLMAIDSNGTSKWVATSTLGLDTGGGGNTWGAMSCASDSVMQGITSDGQPVCVQVTINSPSPFDFSVSSPNVSVVAGQSVTIPVTFGLVSGTSKTVAWNLSSKPSWLNGSWSTASCLPTCTSNFISTAVPAGTAPGTYTAIVNATDGSLTKSGTATINVTAAYVAPSCNTYRIDDTGGTNRSSDVFLSISQLSGSPSVNMCKTTQGCHINVKRDNQSTSQSLDFHLVQMSNNSWTEDIGGNGTKTGTNGVTVNQEIFGGGTMNYTDLFDDAIALGYNEQSADALTLRGGQGYNGGWDLTLCPN